MFVLLEVSTCGGDKGGCGHVCNVWCDMFFFGVPFVSPLSSHIFGFLVPKRSVWPPFFWSIVRASAYKLEEGSEMYP